MDLVIAEKPSVARDLARVLGVPRRGDYFENDRYAISWCIGHLVELEEPAAYDPAWKPWRLEALPMLPAEFRLAPAAHARAQLRTVAKLLRDRRFAGVINACDAGREGELIFRYVYQYAGSMLPVRRLWISSLTDDAIRRGFGSLRPGHELAALADAARSRSEADWLVGMNATRALTVRHRSGRDGALLSIGRVQTPTLALIVAREQEIRAFVPRPYWEVRGELRAEGGTFTARWRHGKLPRLAGAELADQIVLRDGAAGDARVVAVRSKTVREPPPQLFDLTSLQRTANRRFGWSASRTLELAQALYEQHKVITYPRTDSRHLSSDVARELPALFGALAAMPAYAGFAQPLIDAPPRPDRRIVDDAKVSDHHAIIPTGARRSLAGDEARLFELIVRRFLGAFYPDAEIAVTEAWIRVGVGDGPPPPFEAADLDRFVEELPPPPDHYLARGRVRVVAGWQEVAGLEPDRRRTDQPERDDDPAGALPPLREGQRLGGAYAAVARQTTPPPRYTEASLLAAMESAGKQIDDEALREAMRDLGLGTPATRAAIIETLLRRTFIERRASSEQAADAPRRPARRGAPGGGGRAHLVPTQVGIDLIDALAVAQVSSLASPELTGQWEARLARIARGEEARTAFMADIARYVTSVIEAIRGTRSLGPPPHGSPSSAGARSSVGGSKASRAEVSPPTEHLGSAAPRDAASRARAASVPQSSRSVQHATGAAARLSRPSRSGDRSTSVVPRAATPASVGAAAVEALPPALLDAVCDALRSIPAARRDTTVRSNGPVAAAPTKPEPTRPKPKRPRVKRVRAAAAAVPLVCPRCRQGALVTGQRGWGCGRWREGCRFVIWFETAGRRLTEAQLRALITTGKTRKARFTDARGHPVEARLVLDPASEIGVQLARTRR